MTDDGILKVGERLPVFEEYVSVTVVNAPLSGAAVGRLYNNAKARYDRSHRCTETAVNNTCIDTLIGSVQPDPPSCLAALPATPCSVCHGLGVLDDRGFPLRGQPYFDTQDCHWCGGAGHLRGCANGRTWWAHGCEQEPLR